VDVTWAPRATGNNAAIARAKIQLIDFDTTDLMRLSSAIKLNDQGKDSAFTEHSLRIPQIKYTSTDIPRERITYDNFRTMRASVSYFGPIAEMRLSGRAAAISPTRVVLSCEQPQTVRGAGRSCYPNPAILDG
jgi:hypothetical protein